MHKLSNRGYMLVEIILASALAFGIAYVMLNMTIRLKNKNDNLLVETLVKTDQTIIMNGIMSNFKNNDCVSVRERLVIDGKKILIDGNVIDIVNDYTIVGTLNCRENNQVITVKIPLVVPQIKDKNFDIELYWMLIK